MQNREKIIDKVRKLLALSNSSNENEAALAAAKAQRLLAEYNLNMSDLEVKEAGADRSQLDLGKKTLDKWVRILFASVARTFDCHPVSTTGGATAKLSFIGCGADPEVAMYTTQYLIRELERLAKIFVTGLPSDTSNKQKHRTSFLLGAVRGVQEQIRKQKTETPVTTMALVPVKDAIIKKFMDENYSDLKKVNGRASKVYTDAYEQGKASGRNINIARGIGGGHGTVQPSLQ